MTAASVTNAPVSKELSAFFMTTLSTRFGQLPVDYLDLSVDTPSHPSALFVQGNYTPRRAHAGNDRSTG
ncbi:hypothetical protein [Chitinophaga pinensis]|uniref:hypothetical protein n=1 Tax=Chitinophaga pinensis TaxID=79329 RepID=UPI001644D0D3|nr:hypothetical protein [Chitinophaga pinensis]